MTQTERCINELELAGLFDKNSDYGGSIGEAVKELLLVFKRQGHSGMSAQITVELFYKLIKGEVLAPLTNNPEEWIDLGGIYQNKRCHYVFSKTNDFKTAYTIEGKKFSEDNGLSYFTNSDSHVSFTLPGFPPKTQYIFLKNRNAT